MKKLHYLLVALLFTCFLTTGCDETSGNDDNDDDTTIIDDDKDDENDDYDDDDENKPDPNTEDYSGVIVAALDATANSAVLSVRITETYTADRPYITDETTVTWLAYDATESRKCVEFRQVTNNRASSVTSYFVKYLEGNNVYYSNSTDITGAKKWICGVSPDDFWNKFNHAALMDYLKYYCGLPTRDWDKYTWSKDGNEYTASYSSASGGVIDVTEDITIQLNGNKISSIKLSSFDVTDVINEKEKNKEFTFEYTAVPAFPEGFTEQDFEPAEQSTMRVVWGDGLGESTFYNHYQPQVYSYIGYYSQYNNDIAAETIINHAPTQVGKQAEYYYDANFTDRVEMLKPIYDVDVIYVKWVAL